MIGEIGVNCNDLKCVANRSNIENVLKKFELLIVCWIIHLDRINSKYFR